jgi:putative phage-type endonuclease
VVNAPAIIRPEREAWLTARRELLTASDVAAVLGVDPRRGPLAVYCEKLGAPSAEETAWMKWGRRVEGAVADWYADDTGRTIFDQGAYAIQRHPDVPWIGATLDRWQSARSSDKTPSPIADVQTGPLEAKAVAGFKAKEWREDPPLHYVVQLQAQMACTGAQWGTLAALVGGLELVWKDILRSEDFLVAAYPKLEEFWMRVQRREPPPADALPGTTEALKRLWPEPDGETVNLDNDALSLVAKWEQKKVELVDLDDEATRVENDLRARMGSATFGALPDGSYLTLKKTERSAYEVGPTSYRSLRRWWPRRRK